MSRDFSQEYQNYINEQTPDLWAQIEANLCEKINVVQGITAVQGTKTEEGTATTEGGTTSVIELQERKEKKKRTRNMTPFVTYGMTAAAAILICIVALPLLNGGMESADMARNESAYMMVADTMDNGTNGEMKMGSAGTADEEWSDEEVDGMSEAYAYVESAEEAVEEMVVQEEEKNEAEHKSAVQEMGKDTVAETEEVDRASGTANDSLKEEYDYEVSVPNWGISLKTENVTTTGLTLVITQSGGEPTGRLQTGEPYRLIGLVDGVWTEVEEAPLPEDADGRGWVDIAYLIPAGEDVAFEIDWKWVYGELPKGTYRLVKKITDFRKTADYDTFEYWVEFVIE